MSTGDSPPPEGGALRELLGRIRAGDEDAARELLARYEVQVRLVVRRQLPRLLRSRFDSLDFLQSVWGSFFRRVRAGTEGLEEPRNVVAFLVRVARNKVIDQHRRAVSRKHDVRREEPLGVDPDGTLNRSVASEQDSPSEQAGARETFARLRGYLDEDRRDILALKAIGHTNREIGDRLGVSERTVRRALEEVRRRERPDQEE
jgi:RNA polymerase sigma-70 factor (ECF subfamily)